MHEDREAEKELDEAWDLNAIDDAITKCLSEQAEENDGFK
jgi:hypothetical protein